jgi:hypothetical protein
VRKRHRIAKRPLFGGDFNQRLSADLPRKLAYFAWATLRDVQIKTGTVLGKVVQRISLISRRNRRELSVSEYGIFPGKPQNCAVLARKNITVYQILDWVAVLSV